MTPSEWNVPDLLKLSGEYWSTCALHAGVRLNLFTLLAGSELTADEAAARAGADSRATAMLLNALVALGLLDKHDQRYSAVPFASQFLSRSSERYIGHIIMHHHYLMNSWAQLHTAVASGAPARTNSSHDDDASHRESFLMGMFDLASLQAPTIVAALDLSGRRRLLDLGGGPGTYAIHFCEVNPALQATVYDLPTTRPIAEKTIARFGLAERIMFVAGDYHADPVPVGFDVAWLSHVLHSDGPDSCARLLATASAALDPGGILVVQEFILNDTKDGPLFPALFSLNMLIGTNGGQAYAEEELCTMMKATGLVDVQRISIDLPNGAGIIMGTKM